MRFHAAFALLVAGLCTISGAEANIITDQIVQGLEEIIYEIIALGLDPLVIKREEGAYALPVPVIFNTAGYCEDVYSTGLSNIVINDIHYDVLGFRLTFDIEMPHVHVSVGDAAGHVTVFDNTITGEISGSLDIYNVRVRGDLRIGIVGGVGIRSADIDSEIGGVEPNISAKVQEYDLSGHLNGAIITLWNTLDKFKAEIDELIAIVLMNYVNDNILG